MKYKTCDQELNDVKKKKTFYVTISNDLKMNQCTAVSKKANIMLGQI